MLIICGLPMPSIAWMIAGNSFRMRSFSKTSASGVIAPMRTVSPVASIPFRLLMPFKFTSRFGVTIPCLNEVTKSVPPARISVSPNLLSNNPMAVSKSVGLAYSNEFIDLDLHLSFFRCCQNLIGRKRQCRHAHADGVGHRIGNCGAGRNHRRLAQTDHAAFRRSLPPVIMWTRKLPTSESPARR